MFHFTKHRNCLQGRLGHLLEARQSILKCEERGDDSQIDREPGGVVNE